MVRTMKNPLRKRHLRDLKQEIGKYLVIFLLLTASIGFVSGFLVADGSMLQAYHDSFEKYHVEDGNFTVQNRLNHAQIRDIQAQHVTLYELFYTEKELSNDSKLRIFPKRDKVNLACLMQGDMPKQSNEIAIDRMYADNNQLALGDTLTNGTQTWTITGLLALPDYSCLFEKNSDTMFDATKFGVAVVAQDTFEAISSDNKTFCYAWKYQQSPADETEENARAEDFLKFLSGEVQLEGFIPRYANQAIVFAGNDMGSDRGMMIMLLYMIIAIMAFVFCLVISDTIAKEAAVIGTLRASGYTKHELMVHYMTMPVIVTLVSALLGNILGYSFMKNYCAGMYYGSYSLPTYVTIWNGEAFVLTTVIPVLMMMVLTWLILRRKLELSPLQFLRRDLRRKRQKKPLWLPDKIPFFHRFRLRVIFQNIGNYCILLIGILFANLLLMFGLALPDVLDVYQDNLKNNMLCKYQYILQMPYDAMDDDPSLGTMMSMLLFQFDIQTQNEDAEKFTAYTLKTVDTGYNSEEITVYGVQPNSRYIHWKHTDGGAAVSATYAEKYNLHIGDTITLKEAYKDTRYTIKISDIYAYQGALCVFMNQEDLNAMLDYDSAYFSGYLSDTPITDIDEKYISSVIDLDALTKVSRQLDVSMGSMMYLVDGFGIAIFVILMYLLSKIIIEKNAQAISMTKILGYNNREIGGLYLASTSIVVAVLLLCSLPIETKLLTALFAVVMKSEMTGWIPLVIRPRIYVQMMIIGLITYAIVAALEYRKIRRIPMDEALKHVE